MKFKLDENLGPWAAAVLVEVGFDAVTVPNQGLEGASDRDLIECCRREERCLVTLDAEFGNPLLFPPRDYRGIVLLRVPARASKMLILDTVRTLRDALRTLDRPAAGVGLLPKPDRHLWIVQPGRVRLYQGDTADEA